MKKVFLIIFSILVLISYFSWSAELRVGPPQGGCEKGDPGPQGPSGVPGYTPIKGVDYFDGEKGDPGDPANIALHESTYDHSLLHTHNNKALLDTYTQTEANLADAVSKKHNESHNHDGTYEPANANIQVHVTSQHAPSDAQKNSDITKSEIEAKLTGEITSHTHPGGGGGLGYAIRLVSASQATTTDGQTMYWGGMAVAPSTTANRWRTYIPKAGTIKVVYIYSYAGTAGTNENWSMYIRLNNTSDTLIQTLGVATSDRLWSNASLNIAVVAGDYVEIKEIQPTWATNPATVTRNGVFYVE